MNIRNKVIWICSCMVMLIVFIMLNGTGIADYISSVKQSAAVLTMSAPKLTEEQKGNLQELIVQEASKRKIAPIDARIDRVWKAIPGYNGLEVDVKQTYEQTIASGSDSPILYVYKEVPPQINLQQLGPLPIYRGNPEKKMASFMINVAWGNEYITPILDTLEKENVKATFFLDGSWLKKNPEIALQIQAKGHEMSNHAYSHPNMSELNRQAAYAQISKTEDLLKATLNVNNKWFAPPSGDFNQMTVQVAAEQGLQTVLWTIDTVDWMKPAPDRIINKISSKLEPGSLILMHPTASSSQALAGMIHVIKQRGYSLGTVSETLSSDRIPPAVETVH
ncbi:MAG: polysaccharide deacetylase family protein [Candidatus Pristimantibacillus sp.]